MNIKVDFGALNADDIFTIVQSIQIYDSGEGLEGYTLDNLVEVLRKIKLNEVRSELG